VKTPFRNQEEIDRYTGIIESLPDAIYIEGPGKLFKGEVYVTGEVWTRRNRIVLRKLKVRDLTILAPSKLAAIRAMREVLEGAGLPVGDKVRYDVIYIGEKEGVSE